MTKRILLLALLVALVACTNRDLEQDHRTPPPPNWNPKITQFSNCQEIQSYLDAYKVDSDGQTYSSATDAHFQPQVDGVDEGDLLQTDPKYYFFSRPGSIEVVDRTQLKSVKSLSLPAAPAHWVLSTEKQLVSITSDSETTWIRTFDKSHQFSLISESSLQGETIDFRYFNGNLILVTQLYSYQHPDSIDCSKVYRPNLENGSSGLTFIHKIPVQSSSEKIDTLTLWGTTNFFYMTKEELFLFQTYYTDAGGRSGFRVVDWATGSLSFKQAQNTDGFLKDRSAVYQQGSHLILASTNPGSGQGRSHYTNLMVSYKKDQQGLYQRLSSSASFGEKEDIRAVRFVDDKAYVVTFEKTDPLFIFDIKDPAHIQLLSELTVPGFSTQLRPFPNHDLLGVGFDTNSDIGFSWFAGIKISLFDTQNPLAPMQTSALKYGDRGSYSEAAFDSKGLFASESGHQIVVPLVEVEKTADDGSDPWNYGSKHLFSGAVLFEIKNHQISETARFSHKSWREAVCGADFFSRLMGWQSYTPSLDIQRSIASGDCIDTFSRFGVMRFCSGNETPDSSVEFSNDSSLCQPENPIVFL